MTKIKCNYPKCNKDAQVYLGMADPDAEKIPYCRKCAEKVKMNTMMKMEWICGKKLQEKKE